MNTVSHIQRQASHFSSYLTFTSIKIPEQMPQRTCPFKREQMLKLAKDVVPPVFNFHVQAENATDATEALAEVEYQKARFSIIAGENQDGSRWLKVTQWPVSKRQRSQQRRRQQQQQRQGNQPAPAPAQRVTDHLQQQVNGMRIRAEQEKEQIGSQEMGHDNGMISSNTVQHQKPKTNINTGPTFKIDLERGVVEGEPDVAVKNSNVGWMSPNLM